uniref:Uncharacterized protein n=1 Tax=Panulirus argus virus 1 TaxID=380624 RepID=A0A6G9HEK9_9VIRU|nr:hypothetical protein [Panulirus argus virus 1]
MRRRRRRRTAAAATTVVVAAPSPPLRGGGSGSGGGGGGGGSTVVAVAYKATTAEGRGAQSIDMAAAEEEGGGCGGGVAAAEAEAEAATISIRDMRTDVVLELRNGIAIAEDNVRYILERSPDEREEMAAAGEEEEEDDDDDDDRLSDEDAIVTDKENKRSLERALFLLERVVPKNVSVVMNDERTDGCPCSCCDGELVTSHSVRACETLSDLVSPEAVLFTLVRIESESRYGNDGAKMWRTYADPGPKFRQCIARKLQEWWKRIATLRRQRSRVETGRRND